MIAFAPDSTDALCEKRESAMTDQYLLGHSEAERRRLVAQAELLAPMTRRFLTAAGIGPGMRVLDVGTGMGDVALLAADLVGTEGTIVGIDKSSAIVAAASQRVKSLGKNNIDFVVSDPAELAFERPFDAIIGRYVLMFLSDPAATLSALRTKLRSGGVVAFHELDWSGARSIPPAPTYEQCRDWALEAVRLGGADPQMGTRMYSAFVRAGLPPPTLRLESITGGAEDPSGTVRMLCETLFPEAFVSVLERHGIASATTIARDTLPERLVAEIAELGSVIVGRSEICAWTRCQ
jgi:ubiquinone/menaquinone biosynthesis C-methylase UbiE